MCQALSKKLSITLSCKVILPGKRRLEIGIMGTVIIASMSDFT